MPPNLTALKSRLAGRPRRAMARPAAAAVLVPVVDDGGPRRLILTRRTEHLPTHAGQVAFPGGGIDPGDQGPVDAALREAREEIGLPPSRVEVLGLLDDFPTVTDRVVVTPVVGRLVEVPKLVPEPGEVARIFSIPVADLLDPSGWRTQDFERGGRTWPVYFFDYDGETLWGLSAYIVLHLLDLLPEGAPFALPPARVG